MEISSDGVFICRRKWRKNKKFDNNLKLFLLFSTILLMAPSGLCLVQHGDDILWTKSKMFPALICMNLKMVSHDNWFPRPFIPQGLLWKQILVAQNFMAVNVESRDIYEKVWNINGRQFNETETINIQLDIERKSFWFVPLALSVYEILLKIVV